VKAHPTTTEVHSVLAPLWKCLFVTAPFALLLLLTLFIRWLNPLHALLALGGITLFTLIPILILAADRREDSPTDRTRHSDR
jgi:hypothetical protein